MYNNYGWHNTAVGYHSLYQNTSGEDNTCIGDDSGYNIITGDRNVILGAQADVSSASITESTAIGYNSVIAINNGMALGGTGDYQVRVGIGTSSPDCDLDIKQRESSGNGRGIKLERDDTADDWRIYNGATDQLAVAFNNVLKGTFDPVTGEYNHTSDARLKKDISSIEGILPSVLQLQPKSYGFINDETGTRAMGFIAQEVETIFPAIVKEREDGMKALAYDQFSVLAIQAIREQQAIIDQQQSNALSLQNTVAQQQAVINELLLRVQALENE